MNTPEPRSSNDLVLIGAVVAAHGLQGAVRVEPLTDFPERFRTLKECMLRMSDGTVLEIRIKRCKLATNGVLLNFDGIRTRNQAESLRGATIEISLNDRLKLPEDLFYISDMIGCIAVDESGQEVGKLSDVLRGAQDILTIQTPVGDVMVPFVDAWVGDVDLEHRRIVVRRFSELLSSEEIPPAVGERDH
ncbi:16S rRNA processing protein RimM [bacterium]|nr:16S rRNA processing protein RimM [bacterium]